MANLIQIKRSNTTATPAYSTDLANGELGFSGNGDVLFIGNFGAVSAIGGLRTPGTLVANQSIVTDSDNFVDAIKTNSLQVNNYIVTTIIDDDTFVTGVSNTALATSESIKQYVDNLPAAATTLNAMTDTDITGAANGEILVWDDTDWVDIEMSGDATFAKTGVLTLDTVNTIALAVGGTANTSAAVTFNTKGLVTGIVPVNIDHDDLENFASDEHIGHTGVSISTANGITGGGNLTTTRNLYVVANNGITANAGGVWVASSNGTTLTTSGIEVLAGNSQVVSNTTGVWINEGGLAIGQSQVTGDVALGTKTSGNYVESIDNGNGITGASANAEGVDHVLAVLANNGITVTADGVFADGANGISVTADGINVDAGTGVVSNTTGVHIGQAVGTTSDVEFGDMILSGNLTVQGTMTTIDTENMSIQDPLIILASNNDVSDAVDIGFYGLCDPTGSQDTYTGLFRDATDEKWRLFHDLETAPTTTVNTAGTNYAIATLVANIEGSLSGGTISGLSGDIAVTDGGTGVGTFTDNGILYGDGANALDVTAAGTEGMVLQAGSGGVPEMGTLDGGTF